MTYLPDDIEQRISAYLRKPYHYILVQDSNGGWFVRVKELRGCVSDSATWTDALFMITDAMRFWLHACLVRGLPIPEPDEDA